MTDTCEHMALLIQAELDNELDTPSAASLSAHLARCPRCAALRRDMGALSTRLRAGVPRHQAPEALRRAIADALPRPAPRPIPWRSGVPFGAGLAVAACLALFMLPRTGSDMAADVVADHIRALQPGHLTDVISTDQHTVKPWFDGRLDYAPPVRDFAGQGFPLIGGRLDYLAGRPVAALVYRRGKHLIDLYVWPETQAVTRAGVQQGYNFRRWTEDGMAFWAVSDVAPDALDAFQALWQAAPQPPSGEPP